MSDSPPEKRGAQFRNLLDTQAAAVARAYKRQGMRLMSQGSGEWPVLVMRSR